MHADDVRRAKQLLERLEDCKRLINSLQKIKPEERESFPRTFAALKSVLSLSDAQLGERFWEFYMQLLNERYNDLVRQLEELGVEL